MIRIPLRNRAGDVVAHTLIDEQDAALAELRWYRSAQGYAVRTIGQGKAKRVELLHRAILDAPPGSEIDHQNHDRLDNRRSNIRLTDKSGNMQNRGPRAGRDLPRNVYRRDSKYAVMLKVNGRNVTVGRFRTVEEADDAARVARAKHLPMSAEARALRAASRPPCRSSLTTRKAAGTARPRRARWPASPTA